jgi:hypothetical protein
LNRENCGISEEESTRKWLVYLSGYACNQPADKSETPEVLSSDSNE